jgi:hypothetical protein
MMYLAEAHRDYSETEYICMARKLCKTRKEAEEFLKDKCQDLQFIKELQD